MRRLLILLIALIPTFFLRATHIMGGSITYTCENGNYVFELVFFRDCNGSNVNTVSQTIKVWNHPTLNQITVPFVSRIDISPQGTGVPGGPACITCGAGSNNGIGAIEKITYRSAPINISGTPPPSGWVFTYDDFSRNASITNLLNADNYGLTLTATIYNANNPVNTCVDNSPVFLQEPHFVSCVGVPFSLNLNPVDPDLDSIAVSFDRPLNNLAGLPYSPPTNPAAVPYVSGFAFDEPTPGPDLNAANSDAQVDPESGEIEFFSNNSGSFVVKIKVQSFRNNQLISEVVYEMQLIVLNCVGANTPPTVAPPFGATFETSVPAGTLVNFTLSSSDPELLQDGSPQSNIIFPSGLLFGPDYTLATGCLIEPCPTLSSNPVISGTQGASVDFSWQTDCDHLLDANGNELDAVPYHFTFRVQDDYCPVPKVIYKTVTINVLNTGVIQAPPIDCIQGGTGNDFTINWQPVTDPNGTFVEYQIHSVQDGLIATIPTIGTGSYVHTGVTQETDYFLAVVSGCSGNALRYGDTVSGIFLDVNNLTPGMAVLNWNQPTNPPLASMHDYFYIYREYPAGTWSLIDSVPYSTTQYEEIIDICDVFLNYQIVLPNSPCNFTSQIDGDLFDDQTPPDIPVVQSVSIDTLTGETQITWNQNDQPDTYGYLIYVQDPVSGLLLELDTVYGISTTSYTYFENYTDGSVTYTVAAFDSCPSTTGAPFNLSARDPNFHSTVFASHILSVCNGSAIIEWSDYIGWSPLNYEVYIQEVGGAWFLASTDTDNSFEFVGTSGQQYCAVVKANHADGRFSFSNRTCFEIESAPSPSYSYIHTASVTDDQSVEIVYSFDPAANVSRIELEKATDGQFTLLETIDAPSPSTIFEDADVDVNRESYTYRVLYYDSCGQAGAYSNIGKTILLDVQIDQTELEAYLTWNKYEDFNGSVIAYHVYRGIDGVLDPNPIAQLGPSARSYQDSIGGLNFSGKLCYRVLALEGTNLFNNPMGSYSNVACTVIEPLIFVPNAFFPAGINHVFRPVIRNFREEQYRMTIFDRWGQVVFQTSNYLEGWNGKMGNVGAELETATYVYMIEVYDGNGEQIVTRGHVTLLR